MSKKHNTKHSRKRSSYPKRLKKRGLTVAPRLTTLYELRKKPGATIHGEPITTSDLREVRNLG